MAHLTARTGYRQLVERLNRFPQGAPPSETLHAILALLLSEREAGLVSLLPIRPFTVEEAARRWRLGRPEARRLLDELASKAVLLDVEGRDGEMHYVLPPPMAGFFEFSMMRVRGDLDQGLLAELFYEYLNVEEDFIRDLFARGETQLGRVFVDEEALASTPGLEVLDYERASEVARTAEHRAVGLCYCRHKMEHVGRACGAPMEICLTFGTTAASLVRHDYARDIDLEESLDLLQEARDRGLVQFGENVRQGVSFVCNCCGCCCEAMIAARRFGFLRPVHTTNFLPRIEEERCNGCGRCVQLCPVEAMALVSAHDAQRPKLRKAKIDASVCLGCGVCVRSCPQDGIALEPREQRVLTPLDTTHRVVLMALERGQLQELIFDDQALWSHRAMAAILGVILRLPPVRQLLAREQVKSRYLEALVARRNRSSG